MKQDEKDVILDLARNALEYYADGNPRFLDEEYFEKNKFLQKKKGVFVTLKKGKNNELRGCMGRPYPNQTLYKGLEESVIDSAFNDYRFPKVKFDELSDIKIEVTILSKPKKIESNSYKDLLDNIELGKDGLIIKNKNKSALFLPQVPIEWKWNKDTYYTELCDKAGIEKNICKDMNQTRVYKFQGEIIEEKGRGKYE